MLGDRVPISLKVTLVAIAIIDDLMAIIIIATFYTSDVSIYYLLLAAVATSVLFLLNKKQINKLSPYVILGILLWMFVLKSGIHASLAGVLLAQFIPLNSKDSSSHSPLQNLEHSIAPWVNFSILPIFAFANAGVSFSGMKLNLLWDPVTLGIILGLFFGKQIGVFVLSYISVKLKFADKPSNSTWPAFYAVSILTGIGFTMSLFVGNLAFANNLEYMDGVKIGVLTGSLLSTLFGYFLLLIFSKK